MKKLCRNLIELRWWEFVGIVYLLSLRWPKKSINANMQLFFQGEKMDEFSNFLRIYHEEGYNEAADLKLCTGQKSHAHKSIILEPVRISWYGKRHSAQIDRIYKPTRFQNRWTQGATCKWRDKIGTWAFGPAVIYSATLRCWLFKFGEVTASSVAQSVLYKHKWAESNIPFPRLSDLCLDKK